MSKTSTCIIIDDEPIAISVIEHYISQYRVLNIIRSFTSPIEALEFLARTEVDIIFMDIKMPQLNGIKMIQALKKRPLIVITTAYPEYAIEGFEQNVIDYLVKPIDFDRFITSVNRCLERISLVKEKIEEQYIMIKEQKSFHKIALSEIMFIEACGDYAKYHCINNTLTCLQTIKGIEATLPQNLFIRVHKSYLIGKKHITNLVANNLQIKERTIPIGKIYKKEVKAFFEKKI